MSKSSKKTKKNNKVAFHPESAARKLVTTWEKMKAAAREMDRHESVPVQLGNRYGAVNKSFDGQIIEALSKGVAEQVLDHALKNIAKDGSEKFLERVGEAHFDVSYQGTTQDGKRVAFRSVIVAIPVAVSQNTLENLEPVNFSRMAKSAGILPKESAVAVLRPLTLRQAHALVKDPITQFELTRSMARYSGRALDESILNGFIERNSHLEGEAGLGEYADEDESHLVQCIVPLLVFCEEGQGVCALDEGYEEMGDEEREALMENQLSKWEENIHEFLSEFDDEGVIDLPCSLSDAVTDAILARVFQPLFLTYEDAYAHLPSPPESEIVEVAIRFESDRSDMFDVHARFDDGTVLVSSQVLPVECLPRLLEGMELELELEYPVTVGQGPVKWASQEHELDMERAQVAFPRSRLGQFPGSGTLH